MFISSHDAPIAWLRRISRTGCLRRLLLICAILSWSTPGAYAQTQAEEAKDSTVQQAEIEAAEPEAAEPDQETEEEAVPLDLDKPPGRFIPSEEISEDWSVPFPVDI